MSWFERFFAILSELLWSYYFCNCFGPKCYFCHCCTEAATAAATAAAAATTTATATTAASATGGCSYCLPLPPEVLRFIWLLLSVLLLPMRKGMMVTMTLTVMVLRLILVLFMVMVLLPKP